MSNRKQSSKLKKYKIKTNKAAKKRFKKTATGKVFFYPTGHKHLMSAKSSKKRRHSRRMKPFLATHDRTDVIRMLQDEPGI
jgi:large subunit ribosomal protein L35